MGPEGRGTLCNACGLRYRKKLKAESARGTNAKIPMSMLLNAVKEEESKEETSNEKPEEDSKEE